MSVPFGVAYPAGTAVLTGRYVILEVFELFPTVRLVRAELSGIFPVFPTVPFPVVPFRFPEVFTDLLFQLVPFFTGLVGTITTSVFFFGNIHDPSLICVDPAVCKD